MTADAAKLIYFLEFNESHLPLMRKWLRETHVAEFWQEPEDENEFREKYFLKLKNRGISSYIIHLNDTPIGYIQSYEAKSIGSGWWPDAKPGTYGIDQFIGDPEFMNKGLGSIIIFRFVEILFQNSNVLDVIADPDPTNSRAIRAYEKIGFIQESRTQTPGGDAVIVRVDRRLLKKP
jgi:RimJ/RimL family protein N-acetyltransferase